MENETLHIHDSDESTDGGPPAWLAFAVAAGVCLVCSLILIVVLVIFW